LKESESKAIYKRILVPLDGSPLSEAVLPHVQDIAQAMNSEIVFLHVILTPVPEFSTPSKPFARDFVHKQKNKVIRYLKAVCTKLEKQGLHVTYLVREGAVAETILEVAELMQVNMIALSTQAPSAAQLLLLGSVTYQVVRRSPLPMLVIRI
jgi:nucleotide-binding universal stress UspA family protein